MTVPHSGTWPGGRWKLAPCLVAMEAEADRIAPRRRRTSDGSIGDQAHAVRRSDHNPDEEGVTDWVDALDISHDPANGMDIHAHARTIAARRDPRIDYIISNRRIWSRANPTWRTYKGDNPHTLHAHFSVVDAGRGDTSPWFNAVPLFPTGPTPPPYNPPGPAPFTPPSPGVPMRFFITDPAYGIRLVITDGFCIVDQGIKDPLGGQLLPTDVGGPMTPQQFADFCAMYGNRRMALPPR